MRNLFQFHLLLNLYSYTVHTQHLLNCYLFHFVLAWIMENSVSILNQFGGASIWILHNARGQNWHAGVSGYLSAHTHVAWCMFMVPRTIRGAVFWSLRCLMRVVCSVYVCSRADACLVGVLGVAWVPRKSHLVARSRKRVISSSASCFGSCIKWWPTKIGLLAMHQQFSPTRTAKRQKHITLIQAETLAYYNFNLLYLNNFGDGDTYYKFQLKIIFIYLSKLQFCWCCFKNIKTNWKEIKK